MADAEAEQFHQFAGIVLVGIALLAVAVFSQIIMAGSSDMLAAAPRNCPGCVVHSRLY